MNRSGVLLAMMPRKSIVHSMPMIAALFRLNPKRLKGQVAIVGG